MGILEYIIIGIVLSIDAVSVSLCNSIAYQDNKRRHFLIALVFGLFQGLMPIIGYYTGYFLKTFMDSFAFYIAFIILVILGLKMILEHDKDCPKECSIIRVLIQGVATSIDALMIGFSLSLIGNEILFPSLIFFIITFVLCLIALFIGKKLSGLLGKKANIIGGIVLILIGFKILFEGIF